MLHKECNHPPETIRLRSHQSIASDARSMRRLVWALTVIASVGMIATVVYVVRLDSGKILATTPLLIVLGSVLIRALDLATRSYRGVREDLDDLRARDLAAGTPPSPQK